MTPGTESQAARSSRSLATLSPGMQDAVQALQARLQVDGVRVLPLDAYRSPWDQARAYRQGHTWPQIRAMEDRLTHLDWAGFAVILRAVGPQYGLRVTEAPPGQSWHQWGDAWDACPWVDSGSLSRLAWEPRPGDPDYNEAVRLWQRYGRLAEQCGLVWGGHWGDAPHVQCRDMDAVPLVTVGRPLAAARAEELGWWHA